MLQYISGVDRRSHVPGRVTLNSVSLRTARYVLALFVMMIFLAIPLSAFAQRGVSISYLIDPSATLGIEEVSSPPLAGEYREYVPSSLAFSRLSDNFNGAIWFRITLDPAFEKPASSLRIDMGSGLPGITRLFIPHGNGAFTIMESAPPQGMFTLPENTPFPDVLYARIDGTPSLWFKPHLGPVNEGLGGLPIHFILAGFFGLAMLVLFIQYVRKAEEWRLWAAITAGCGAVAAILPPTPSAGAAFTPLMATAMVMPGLVIVLFVHTIRHLFDSPRTMRGYDLILVSLYLVGGMIALLPLVPGFLWVARYLPFTAIVLLPFLPLSMVAMARSLRGCSAFFCASLLPIAGIAASAWELTAADASLLSGNGGGWGLALALLILSFIAPAKSKAEAKDEEDVFDSLNRSLAPSFRKETGAAEQTVSAKTVAADTTRTMPLSSEREPLSIKPALASPDSDPDSMPDARATTVDEFPSLSLFGSDSDMPEQEKPDPLAEKDVRPKENATTAAENGLPIPDSALERFSSAFRPIEETPKQAPPSIPVATPGPVQVLSIVDTEIEPRTDSEAPFSSRAERPAAGEHAHAPEMGEDRPPLAPSQERRIGRRMLFNLPILIKNTYDAIAPLSEKKNVGMTWFIAPQTGNLFEGEADLLESALRLLLRDMVEAVDHGNVRLNVRRLPDSSEGHLVFSIAEWDAKQSAYKRKIAGLADAWTLAEITGGIFRVEHSPTGGTTVLFSAVFTAMDNVIPTASNTKSTARPEASSPEQVARLATAHAGFAQNQPSRNSRGTARDVQFFNDYPDVVMPDAQGGEMVASASPPSPSGVDAGVLAENRQNKRDPSRIIVADSAASSRARTTGVFAGTPYSVLECTSPSDACALYSRHPSALIIMNADMPEMDIAAALKDIRTDDEVYGRSPVYAIALVGYEAQAARMMHSGCSRTVLKNVVSDELLPMVESLIPYASSTPEAPVPETVLGEVLTFIPPIEPAAAGTADGREEDVPAAPVSGIFASVLPPSEPEEAVSAVKTSAGPTMEQTSRSSGLGLLDMIVTDEDDEEAKEAPAPERTAETGLQVPTAMSVPHDFSTQSVPETPRTPEPEQVPEAPPAPPVPQAPQVPEDQPTPESQQVPKEPEPTPKHKSDAKAKKSVHVVIRTMGGAHSPVEEAKAEGSSKGLGQAGSGPVSIPLPGEEDSVFKDMVPLIPGLIIELTDAISDAARGKAEKSPMMVQEAAGRVAGKAESFGLARLERMARCVERAAAADDIEPMECVLEDLEAWIERYKEALRQLHRDVQW